MIKYMPTTFTFAYIFDKQSRTRTIVYARRHATYEECDGRSTVTAFDVDDDDVMTTLIFRVRLFTCVLCAMCDRRSEHVLRYIFSGFDRFFVYRSSGCRRLFGDTDLFGQSLLH